MVKVFNDTPGLICVDVPATVKEQIDPMSTMLDGFDFGAPMSAETMIKLLVADKIGDRLAKAQAVQAQRDAQQRAKKTVDLYPAHQGEGKPPLVNEIDDEVWARIRTMPVIARKLDERTLRLA